MKSNQLNDSKPYSAVPQLGIKEWAEEDRPREKLLLKGRAALSDAELLAILLGSGSRKETAVGLAKRILQSVGGNLNELGRLRIAKLMAFRGIGEAKGITIQAAMELGRRRQLSPLKEKPQLRSSQDAYLILAGQLADLPHEEFWILCLNRANRIVHKERISAGGTSGTVVDAKVVFIRALEQKASSIILVHNHPSGSLTPSDSDISLTKKLALAGKTLDIQVLDHVIIADSGYYSFADEGEMS